MVEQVSEDPRPLLVVMSHGGQGRVALDAILACGRRPGGILDDSGATEHHGIPVLGSPADWPTYAADARFVLAFGGSARLALGRAMVEAGAEVGPAIHPGAHVSPLAHVGPGLVALHGATVHVDARVGSFCIVNAQSAIDHDCVLGDGVTLGPGVTFPGGVTVGEGASIGAGVVVLPGKSIGRGATIGAGAVVTKDVADGVTVAGNPARPLARK